MALALIERPTYIFGNGRTPHQRMLRGVELRALSRGELAAAGPGGRWLRRERRRRARALLLGALELRWNTLQCYPECIPSLWKYGLPVGGGFTRGSAHVSAVRRQAFRKWW